MKLNWLHTPCFAPFDDSSGGNSGIEPFIPDDDEDEVIDGDEDEDEDSDDNSDDDDDDSLKTVNPPFNPDAFAKAITDGLRPALQQQQPRLTREEIEKQLGKPNPTVELIQMIRDPDTPPEKALAALSSLMNSQNEYLLKASGMAIDGRVQELDPHIKALQQHQRSQQEKEFASSVVQKFPALKGKGPAITQAIQLLANQGYKMNSISAAKRDVANMASRLIKQYDTNFSLKPKKQQSTSFLRPGAGGGRSGSGGKRASVIDQIFSVK
jgi:hypothetical protein